MKTKHLLGVLILLRNAYKKGSLAAKIKYGIPSQDRHTKFDKTVYYNEGNYGRFNPNSKRAQAAIESSVTDAMREQ
jgi:hypothetical protein